MGRMIGGFDSRYTPSPQGALTEGPKEARRSAEAGPNWEFGQMMELGDITPLEGVAARCEGSSPSLPT
jgi:hypothetical protein